MTKPSVTVIGFGRFGALWAKLLKPLCNVSVVEPDSTKADEAVSAGFSVLTAKEGLQAETCFYCVPIAAFEEIITEHSRYFDSGPKQIFDCLSVKIHPRKIFDRFKKSGIEFGLLHPLFGPDSVKAQGVQGFPIALDRYTLSESSAKQWIHIFKTIGLEIIELSAEEHDRLAAHSQGLAHYVGRILGGMNITPSQIDTLGATKLHEIKEQVCNDTPELFFNLQQYNPYTLEMRIALGKAQKDIYASLLPDRVNAETLIVGIQGGPGSFNEEAALKHMATIGEENFKLVYLYTTGAVLKSLYEGRIDRGIFAIHNAIGGVVDESIKAMAEYTFSIAEEFSIIISHCVLMHPDCTPEQINSIMGHSQAIKQCQQNLKKKFPKMQLVSGEGELADPSKASEELIKGTLPLTTAILGSKELARIYGLKIIERGLQDLAENYTAFLYVKR